ncbi:MAG: AAA family ATPase, partial [Patescibacteria group bacterium]
MNNNNNSVPWLDLIKFHKEVLRRGAESFYTLPATDNGRERWGELLNFSPESLAGPWELSLSDISHKEFVRRIKSEEITELFIGGPCWHKRTNYRGNWFSIWVPVLCREVIIEKKPDNKITLKPQQGYWDISPLVFKFFERKSIRPEDKLEDLFPSLIEKAHNISGKDEEIDLTEHFKKLIARKLPELGNKLKAEPKFNSVKTIRSNWTLFVPPTGVSIYTRYLMRDYQKLEKQLEQKNKKLGGLKLLSPESEQREEVKNEESILPIVPLNTQQEKAVSEILGNKPISVISGPPGCGKSQVVVSTVLNAWAKGEKVLFASTTNQAVEVVKDRLKEFEKDVPIAVRAGSKRHSNVIGSLRRVLKLASLDNKKLEDGEIEEKKDNLLTKKENIKEMLDSELPQRINESLRSSLKAYGKYRELVSEIRERKEDIQNQIHDLNLEKKPPKVKVEILKPLNEWLDSREEVKEKIQNDKEEQKQLKYEIKSATKQRNQLLQSIGLNTEAISDWDWLEQGPGPELIEEWYEGYKEFLQKPLENSLKQVEWDSTYDKWEGSKNTQKWINSAQDIQEKIQTSILTCKETVQKIIDVQERRNESLTILKKHGLDAEIEYNEEIISNWISQYAKLCSLSESIWDWLPWSKKSRIKRKLSQFEDDLRAMFPLNVWREIGEINEEGREQLSKILEDVDTFIRINSEWQNLKEERQKISDILEALRAKISQIRYISVPEQQKSMAEWRKTVEVIEKQLENAKKARKAWEKKEKKRKIEQKLSNFVNKFDNIASGIPLKETWIEGKGQDFVTSLHQLRNAPSPENIKEAKKQI